MLNEKGVMTQLVTDECRALTGSFATLPKVQRLFNFHKCEWRAWEIDSYSEEIVWDFYASYVASL